MGGQVPTIRNGGQFSIVGNAVLRVANLFAGHGRPLDAKPPPARPRQRHTYAIGSAEQQSVSLSKRNSVPRAVESREFPCLGPRGRSLTPPPHDQSLNQQTQSPFFRLPRDVLFLIYEEIIGNRTLHVVRRKRRLGHALCQYNSPGCQEKCKEGECRGLKVQTGLHTEHDLGNKDIVPFLQTCKKVYMDAIDTLYASNTFDIDSMETLVYFSNAILPNRFDSIHKLQLDFRFNISLYFDECTPFNDFNRWERIWRIIASMGSLQQLWIRVTWPRALYSSEERKYLAVLTQVDGLKTFEVSLSPLKDKETQKGDYCFHITRRAQ